MGISGEVKLLFFLDNISVAMKQGCGQWQINVCVKASSLGLSAALLEDKSYKSEDVRSEVKAYHQSDGIQESQQ